MHQSKTEKLGEVKRASFGILVFPHFLSSDVIKVKKTQNLFHSGMPQLLITANNIFIKSCE